MAELDRKFRTTQINGEPLKPLPEVIRERRATPHFTPVPVPREVIEEILYLGSLAPSSYNLQPWRFIVVEAEANRKKLQAAAFKQPKVAEAPVVFICCGDKQAYRRDIDEIMAEGIRRGVGDASLRNLTGRGSLLRASNISLSLPRS